MEPSSGFTHLPADCRLHMLMMCNMSAIKNLYCTSFDLMQMLLHFAQHDHRIWSILIAMRQSAPENLIRPCPATAQEHLLQLCPQRLLHGFLVHSYIWKCNPPDLSWALHEVQCMVLIQGLRHPAGVIGVKKKIKQLRTRAY